MRHSAKIIGVLLLFAFVAGAFGAVEKVTVPQGTQVLLVFDQGVSSKTAKVGSTVKLHVRDNVMAGDKRVITKGTPVTGVLTKVDKRKRYGVNAEIMITLNPVQSTFNQKLPLEPRKEGEALKGKKTGQAAAATAGGAIVLGPVGLVGGFFIHGKRVVIKQGDLLDTNVSRTTMLTRQMRDRR